jgi:hypothetical protein
VLWQESVENKGRVLPYDAEGPQDLIAQRATGIWSWSIGVVRLIEHEWCAIIDIANGA